LKYKGLGVLLKYYIIKPLQTQQLFLQKGDKKVVV